MFFVSPSHGQCSCYVSVCQSLSTMDDIRTRAVFVYLMNKVIKKKKQRRKWWIHPTNSSRLVQGAFYTLYEDLKADDAKFFEYFHMSYPTFQELVAKVRKLFPVVWDHFEGLRALLVGSDAVTIPKWVGWMKVQVPNHLLKGVMQPPEAPTCLQSEKIVPSCQGPF